MRNKKVIILSIDFKSNPLWIDEYLVIDRKYKRILEGLVENLFGYELINLYSSQDEINCNCLMTWSKSIQKNCIHGLGSNFVYYVISNIPIYSQIINFEILNEHENPNSKISHAQIPHRRKFL
jgi:hypothetical protein